MDPDEMILMEYLPSSQFTPHFKDMVLREIRAASVYGYDCVENLRQQSRDGIEGATSALNAAERIYGKRK